MESERTEYWDAATAALVECYEAVKAWPPMRSAHEGYSILREEVKELEVHVFQKPRERDLLEMKKEAVQVAAMALRFIAEICTEERGRL